jgi:hypothetical protein
MDLLEQDFFLTDRVRELLFSVEMDLDLPYKIQINI